MGKKVSKRLLSLFLSVLMLATSLPFAGLSASAADESSNLPKSTSGAYLFAYFRNDAKTTNGENVFYAVSKDGYNYEALNGGVPVASASQGTGHSRDPYIMKAQDGAEYKYYMVATDANTTNNYNNTGLHTWGSNDLITWDELANPQFATDKGGGSKTITNMCWAPEAIWDPVAGKYMVYFATNEADSAANESAKIYYSYTADFRTFTEKKVLFDPGYGVIDADITPYGNGYVMLYKKEASSGTGAKKVWYTFKTGKSPSNSDGEYDAANAKIFESVSNTQAEGPQVFPISGTSSYGVLVDYFSDGGFGFSYTSDFESYSKISADNCSINHLNPSHGCIIPISDMEYYNLSQAFGKATSTQTAVKPGDTGGQVVYGEGATGKLTDVNIYRGTIDAYDLFIKDTSAYAEALIRENMELFKSTMKTFSATNILTNMAPAYKLYDKASRYLDAVKLGKTVPDMEYVAKLNADLYAAIQKMTPYKAEFSTVGAQVATGKGDGSAYETVNAKYSQNLLYAGPTSKANASNDVKTFLNNRYEIYYNSAVFLYDGSQNDTTNIMCMPVVMSQIRDRGWHSNALNGLFPAESTTSGNANPYFRLISDYPQSSGKPNLQADATNENLLTTDQMWRGVSTTNWEFGNYIGTSNSKNIAGERENHWNHTSEEFDLSERSTHLWYNVLQFMPDRCMAKTGKTSPEGVYTIPWGIYGDTNGEKDNYDKAANNCKGIINDATKIYVIDVNSASPTTLMDRASEKLKNVDKFQGANMYQLIRSITRFSADTAMEILSGMDAATSWNPATDLNATDGGAFYNQFVEKRNDLVQDFDTAVDNAINTSKGMDEQGYTKLDADMDASSAIGKIYQDAYDDLTDGDSSTGAYTDSSAAAFIKAFDAAKQHYTDLSPVATANRTDKNNPYADNKAQTASKLHDDLVLAYAKLMKRADYSQLNQLYGGSDRVQISNNGLTKNVINENNETVRQQNYTLSTWLTFDDAATAAMKLSDNKDANANATYTKSEKTNQPMFKTGEVKVETLLRGTVTLQGTTTELSKYQTDINTKKDALDAAIKGIKVPADYTAYDAFVVVLGTQDKNAFTDEYLAQDGYTDGQVKNVFKAQAYQGSQSAAVAYNTDGTNNDRAYVEYNGSCYRNIGQSAADTELPGQKVLDSTTSALVTALNNANNSDTLRRQFSVTFQYVVDDAAPIILSKDQSYFYGTVGTFTVPEGVVGSVYKWSVTAGGKEKDVLNYGTTYTLRMQNENAAADSILVTAYLTTDTAPAENQVQLSVQDQYRTNVYQGTLLQDTNVTVSQLEQVQLGDNAIALTGSAYYKLAGWQVMEGDKPHNINYGTYTLADLAKIAGGNQVILRPVYVYNGQDVFTVSLDGQQLDAKGYDVRVSVPKAADAYALAVKTGSTYAIATYGSAYDFYIDGSNKEFFTVKHLPAEKDERGDVIRAAGYYVTDGGKLVRLDTDANIRYSLEHKFPTAFSVGLKSKSADTTFSTYSAATTGLPADVKITEMGTLYTRDAAMATDAAFTVDSVQAGKNVKMVKAKSPIDFSNQFILNYKNANAAAPATYTRAYVKFTYTYETKLVTGGTKTTTVQCIAYGNICDNRAFLGA